MKKGIGMNLQLRDDQREANTAIERHFDPGVIRQLIATPRFTS
jgi:hypothetical protein